MTFANWAIGVKSSTPRKGIWGISAGFIACVLIEPTSSVYPSGLALATTAEPIFPEAPALLSTITGFPRDFPSRSASARAKISVEPPAAHGTIKVTGFSGKAAGAKVDAASASARKMGRKNRGFMVRVPMGRWVDGSIEKTSTPDGIALHSARIRGGPQQQVALRVAPARARGHAAFGPRRPDMDLVPLLPQRVDLIGRKPGLQGQFIEPGCARPKGRGKMIDIQSRCVDPLLEIHAMHRVAQKERACPLILLIPAGCAKHHIGFAILESHRWRQRGAWHHARRQGIRQRFVQPGHLQPGIERKAQRRNGRAR